MSWITYIPWATASVVLVGVTLALVYYRWQYLRIKGAVDALDRWHAEELAIAAALTARTAAAEAALDKLQRAVHDRDLATVSTTTTASGAADLLNSLHEDTASAGPGPAPAVQPTDAGTVSAHIGFRVGP